MSSQLTDTSFHVQGNFLDLKASVMAIYRRLDALMVLPTGEDPWVDTHPRLVSTPHAVTLKLSEDLNSLTDQQLEELLLSASISGEDMSASYEVAIDGYNDLRDLNISWLSVHFYSLLIDNLDDVVLAGMRVRRALRNQADAHPHGADSGLVGWTA